MAKKHTGRLPFRQGVAAYLQRKPPASRTSYEKQRKRKNVPESEYLTQMQEPGTTLLSLITCTPISSPIPAW